MSRRLDVELYDVSRCVAVLHNSAGITARVLTEMKCSDGVTHPGTVYTWSLVGKECDLVAPV